MSGNQQEIRADDVGTNEENIEYVKEARYALIDGACWEALGASHQRAFKRAADIMIAAYKQNLPFEDSHGVSLSKLRQSFI
jgi:hypothetical protein